MPTWLLVSSITLFLLMLVLSGRIVKEGFYGGGGHGGGGGGHGGGGHGGGGHGGGGHGGGGHGGGGWGAHHYGGGGGGGGGGWYGGDWRGWYGFPYGWYPPLTQCYRDWWGNTVCSLEPVQQSPENRNLPYWW